MGIGRNFLSLLALLGSFAAHAAASDNLAQRVVIVYNEREPESRPLAEYYAQKRGVPTNQICAVHVRNVETITRKEFNENLREPILRFLARSNLLLQQPRNVVDPVLGSVPTLETVASRISYIALMYGVPLRIESDPNLHEKPPNESPAFKRDEASVESELATLPTTGIRLRGFVRNPFFNSGYARFEPEMARAMVLVGRLDAPTAAGVRRMIDDALTAERYGLHGRAYFDAQGTHEAGYAEGDDWIKASEKLFREVGYECELDERSETFGEDYPMSDVAVYAGWYAENANGPFGRKSFRFKTGAVAYHLHSWSAMTIHTETARWVGPLLARGAAATWGNVWEPYLSYTPHIDVLFKRLLEGAPFLEAAYYSEPVLSWQTTFVGDPLYRPFAATLDEQIARLDAEKNPDLAWAYVRQTNLLASRGQSADAVQLCREKAESLASPVLWEKLGDLLRATSKSADAIEPYKKAMAAVTDAGPSIRIATKLAHTYESAQQTAQALAVYERLIAAFPSNHNAIDFYKKARDLAATLGDEKKSKSFQARIDQWLAQKKPAAK